MLSYQHLFHAGNFADVHKHSLLTLLLQALLQKPTPYCYIETHAGRAWYDLSDGDAQKTQEYRQGVLRVIESDTPIAEILPYYQHVRACNPHGLRFYPGSPWFTQRCLREQDRMVLAEMHPAEAACLREVFNTDSRVSVHQRDGYEMLRAVIPPPQRRGLILIDPSYEIDSDYEQVIACLERIYRHWRSAMVMVWYPILESHQRKHWVSLIRSAKLRDVIYNELYLRDLDGPRGMKGSGVVIMNPPWKIATQLEALLPWLGKCLAVDLCKPCWSCGRLIAE